jgi:hypothetical protein
MTGPADPGGLEGQAQASAPPPGARPRVASGDTGTRLGGRTVVIVFGIALLAILVAAAAVALLVQTPEPPPDCQLGTDCGGPPPPAEVSSITIAVPDPGTGRNPPAAPGPVGIRAGTPWRSSELGYEFEYSDWWKVDSSDGRTAGLVFQGDGDAECIVAGVPSSEASPQAYADQWFGELQKFAPDITADSQAKNEILGPAIGFVDGIGRTYAGSKSGAFGATSPIGISLVTATDGRTTVAIILVVWDPESSTQNTWQQYFVRGRAELSLKTFRWES